jgi:hypothetical protein
MTKEQYTDALNALIRRGIVIYDPADNTIHLGAEPSFETLNSLTSDEREILRQFLTLIDWLTDPKTNLANQTVH